MIKQIKDTISWDCNESFYIEEIERLKNEIKQINIIDIRENLITDLLEDIEYHKKKYTEESIHVEDCNKWVKEVFDTLKD